MSPFGRSKVLHPLVVDFAIADGQPPLGALLFAACRLILPQVLLEIALPHPPEVARFGPRSPEHAGQLTS